MPEYLNNPQDILPGDAEKFNSAVEQTAQQVRSAFLLWTDKDDITMGEMAAIREKVREILPKDSLWKQNRFHVAEVLESFVWEYYGIEMKDLQMISGKDRTIIGQYLDQIRQGREQL